MFAVAVAIGLTPEMLPVIVTANLARGATRLARERVIVSRLEAIQDLGALAFQKLHHLFCRYGCAPHLI